MNPSYMASMKALSTLYLSAFMGIEPKPVVKKEKETSINGRAFAPGKGVQQEMSGPEKEAKVDAHLAQLRKDVEVRTGVMGGHKYERVGYPRSDLIVMAEEEQAERDRIARNIIHTTYKHKMEEL